jgi:hypothetical protein
MDTEHTEPKRYDKTLTSAIEIKSNTNKHTGLIDLEDLDNLKVKSTKVKNNTIRIVDITRNKYNSEVNIINQNEPKEYLGILPVITTAINALYY